MPTPLLLASLDFQTFLRPWNLAVIHANGRLTFEDDLRSGGLLYFDSVQSKPASVRSG